MQTLVAGSNPELLVAGEICGKEVNAMSLVKLQTEEVKGIQLEILDVVAKFCEENAINYWIDSGTLLGAVRHKGYIPWDDDIDVGMLREDYDRFAAIFNETNDRYRFWCIENNPNFHLPHGKVLDTTTVLYEPDEKGFKLSVNIDIFVYDNAPDDDRIVQKMFDRRDALRIRFNLQTLKSVPKGNALIKATKYAGRIVCRLFAGKNLIEKMVENSKRFSGQETDRVGNFTAFSRSFCHKRVFEKFILLEFEGKKYNAPVGYDEWLRAFYGDYMQLPPPEKRVSHHSYVAFRDGCDE